VSEKRFVLAGHPVSHSLSPAIHRAAFRALGLAHRYEVVDCPEEREVRRVFAKIRDGELAGANVTLPWKRFALEHSDEADGDAREVGAANVLTPAGEGVAAYNTDVPALVEELGRVAPGATRALVIGAGGAALAAVCACRRLGFKRVVVLARRFRGRDPLAPDFARLGASIASWPADDPWATSQLEDVASRTDLVVQATSAGMSGGQPGDGFWDLLPWRSLPASAAAYDVVYTPAVTPFMSAAKEHGLAVEGGLGMLVLQAAHTLRIWLAIEPPLDVMRSAAEQALSGDME
jgi:shikimate dehydrogenase